VKRNVLKLSGAAEEKEKRKEEKYTIEETGRIADGYP
jgi:hypothetical protein